jgi:hypothetical protein
MKQHASRIAGWSKLPLLVVFALLACVLVFAACGGGGSTTGETESTTAEESGGGEEEKVTGEPIVTWTYTDVNTEGPQYKNIEETERVYQEWINTHGGISGRPLEAHFCDAHGTPTGVAACGREAVAGGAVAVVGNFTFTGDAIIPILEKGKTAQWGNCCAIAPTELTSKISFPMGNQPLYSVGLVKKAVEDGCKNINGVIIEGAEAFIPLMENAAKAEGTKINKFVTLPATAQDYSPQVAEATSGGADCLVMIVSETPYIAWMPAFAQSGSEAKMYGPQGNFNENAVKGFAGHLRSRPRAGLQQPRRDGHLGRLRRVQTGCRKHERQDRQRNVPESGRNGQDQPAGHGPAAQHGGKLGQDRWA